MVWFVRQGFVYPRQSSNPQQRLRDVAAAHDLVCIGDENNIIIRRNTAYRPIFELFFVGQFEAHAGTTRLSGCFRPKWSTVAAMALTWTVIIALILLGKLEWYVLTVFGLPLLAIGLASEFYQHQITAALRESTLRAASQ